MSGVHHIYRIFSKHSSGQVGRPGIIAAKRGACVRVDASCTQLRRTASLQRGVLRPVLAVRLLAGSVGGIFVPFAMGTGAVAPAWGIAVFATCLLGEIAERLLFFASVSPDKMPGMP